MVIKKRIPWWNGNFNGQEMIQYDREPNELFKGTC
jgi:hypothetical protein